MLAVARGHPLAKRGEIAFADVLDQNFVGLDRASAIQRFLADKAARAGKPLRLRIQLRSFDRGVPRGRKQCRASALCRRPPRAGRPRTMAIASAVALKDSWATVLVRTGRSACAIFDGFAELRPAASVDYLRARP